MLPIKTSRILKGLGINNDDGSLVVIIKDRKIGSKIIINGVEMTIITAINPKNNPGEKFLNKTTPPQSKLR